MFLFRSEKNHPEYATLINTSPSGPTEDAAERKARHLATLRRLTELGLRLAERVFQEADQEPAPQKTGHTARPATQARLVFARLSRDVRDNIALENILADGKIPAPTRERPSSEPQTTVRPALKDHRRAPISEYIHDAIEDSTLPKPERATLHDQVEPLIEQHLEHDPCQDHLGGEIAAVICQKLGIPFKPSRMQAELLIHPGQPVIAAARQRQAHISTGPDPPETL